MLILDMKLWTCSVLSAGSLRVHKCLPNQATCFVDLEKVFDSVMWVGSGSPVVDSPGVSGVGLPDTGCSLPL